MNVQAYIKSECERQHTTLEREMEDALIFARTAQVRGAYEFNKFVQSIAARVEPDVNAHQLRGDRYRNLRVSEIGFMHGGTAVKAADVFHAYDRWANAAWMVADGDFTGQGVEEIALVDQVIKALLDIHPWADGNGRTASILRNWMLGLCYDPEPLPFYYGQS